MRRIYSKLDKSVNFILPNMLECRNVRRADDYVAVYVSSHTGCKMGCGQCWLTNTKQTSFHHATIDEYDQQLNIVLDHAKSIDGSNSDKVRVNINFMARGEALANRYVVNQYKVLHDTLQLTVDKYNYKCMKINISTIMPTVIRDRSLTNIFGNNPVNIYYSLYSINDKFRKKWIPNAMPWGLALDKLRSFQEVTNNTVVFHFALIEGENDDLTDVKNMAQVIKNLDFKKTKFNLVRFNPHPTINYREPPVEKLHDIFEILRSVCLDTEITTHQSRIIDRVGYDAYTSCGTFPEDKDL
ncbi:putative Fe-S-cluster redox enzyme/ribosomal RNA large subunit methyltransferase [Cotonvirus japonicus]|uniref:Fe-S-cluster redox enzyme/ribosomal RNA large subunit methyltransferase n=1 Tax=Cotonvirus japonicus TaxID=2811091 RepID=A0ABM7NTM9_9VIRU|nr:putative Fe-S-cluster redox enzyme/ribosomal RNA large subunit methyltransferase [Cotonvirus japonicus]BCS83538.1 putative Fe-S-cluster redox enzyme/ribosomal RNA large subunit methyltransferase [Cotonvirus japonicus]